MFHLSRFAIRRLNELVKALESPDLNKNNFDLSYWADGDHKPKKPTLECGTVACAIGLATTLPNWKRHGLKLERENLFSIGMFDVVFKEYTNFLAVAMFLDIPTRDAEFLFSPLNYSYKKPGPTTVAKRIRKYIDDNREIT